jgi:integrase
MAMSRTVKDVRLSSRAAREGLTAQGKPHYRAIEQGAHLGYRKGQTSGRWVVRLYDKARDTYVVETVAFADDKADADGVIIMTYAQAVEAVRARFVAFRRVQAGLRAQDKPPTVGDAVTAHVEWIEQHKRSGRDARLRARLIVEPLGDIPLAQLRPADIKKWLADIAAQPSRSAAPASAEEARRRRRATCNRILALLRASLNSALAAGLIDTDAGWRSIRPFKDASRPRQRFLTEGEATRLINASDPDFRALVQAALLTGCRHGELCALVASDFDAESGTMFIRRSKTGRSRRVALSDEGLALFAVLTVGRAPDAPLLTRADGRAWVPGSQIDPMERARARAGLDRAVTFHVLRHSYISFAVAHGCPLPALAETVGHGSVTMIERVYGHLRPNWVADNIRASVPRFGIEATNVAVLRR